MKDKLLNYFDNLNNNNKIGHAFLICNCDLSFIYEELEQVLSKYFFKKNVDIRNNEDIILIEPENSVIKKEKIQYLHDSVNITSQTSGIKVYIISDCELMNDSAANSLLKLLEEPEDNIYAFLISSNVLNVIKTIYSRCQILNFYNEDYSAKIIEDVKSSNDLEDIISLVELIEKEKTHSIAHYGFISKKVKDREYLRKAFYVILLIYRELLNIKFKNNVLYFNEYYDKLKKISDFNTNEELVNKLTKINKFIYYIDYNLNTSLLLDRFIIEIVGEENE